MAVESSNDDCYFYFYSSCTRGSECPFRHCELALGTETVCSLWREGRCARDNCKFRHMESRINRNYIPCYWEGQPGGCRKPHCVFRHKNVKTTAAIDQKPLILPVATTPAAPLPAVEAVDMPAIPPYEEGDAEVHSPVPPLVVSFDEGEESDTESVSNTPVKTLNSEGHLVNRNNAASDFSMTPPKDIGIKTLEQIRMEKIHKESEHFYKSAYDVPTIDVPRKKRSAEVVRLSSECYPPESEFISILPDRNIDKRLSSEAEMSKQESDLRRRLIKKRPLPFDEDTVPAKRSLTFKRNNEEESPLDFKIKTLQEIRKEKESKQGTQIENVGYSKVQLEKAPSLNGEQISSRKLKIVRPPNDLYPKSPEGKNSTKDGKKEILSQMVLHEVQNISDGQVNSGTEDNTERVKGTRLKSISCLVPGKRKAAEDEEESRKVARRNERDEVISSTTEIQVKEKVSSIPKSLGCFLRRRTPGNAYPGNPVPPDSEVNKADTSLPKVTNLYSLPEKEVTETNILHSSPSKEVTKTNILHSSPSKEVTKTNILHSSPSKEVTKTDILHSSPSREVTKTDILHSSPLKEVTKTNILHSSPPKKVIKTNILHSSPSKEVTKTDVSPSVFHTEVIKTDIPPKEVAKCIPDSPLESIRPNNSISHLKDSTPGEETSGKSVAKESRNSSIDEFENFLEETDDVNLEEDISTGDDILLEIEQFLDS